MTDPNPPLGLRAGFIGLFVFAALGLVLEALHGFKIGFYLDVDSESRRLLWRLAHAHGGLLGLLNVGHALTVRAWPKLADRATERSLLVALLLMPAGFFLGGLFARGADPGPAVGIAAAGAVALLFGLGRFAVLLLERREP
jgi:hypothetical protein